MRPRGDGWCMLWTWMGIIEIACSTRKDHIYVSSQMRLSKISTTKYFLKIVLLQYGGFELVVLYSKWKDIIDVLKKQEISRELSVHCLHFTISK